MFQNTMDASWLYGSATYFKNDSSAVKIAEITVPPNTSISDVTSPHMRATMKLSHTANRANTKANTGVNSVLENSRMESAAPKPAPDDTPKIPWLTSGFWNRPWKAHPLAARAAPTSAPIRARVSAPSPSPP